MERSSSLMGKYDHGGNNQSEIFLFHIYNVLTSWSKKYFKNIHMKSEFIYNWLYILIVKLDSAGNNFLIMQLLRARTYKVFPLGFF